MIEKKQEIMNKIKYYSDLLFQNYVSNIENPSILNLRSCCEIRTGRLNAEDANDNGLYPFFTCGKDELAINKCSFDGPSIIIAGNGEISCKYYDGKFDAYQRTYVLQPTNFFYLFIKACENGINDLKTNSQGSVIKFITKGMLENITINVNKLANNINIRLKSLYDLLTKTQKECKNLKKIKQLLLEKYF